MQSMGGGNNDAIIIDDVSDTSSFIVQKSAKVSHYGTKIARMSQKGSMRGSIRNSNRGSVRSSVMDSERRGGKV